MNANEFGTLMIQRGCVGNEENYRSTLNGYPFTYCGSFNGYPFTVRFVNGRTGGKTKASLQMQFNKAAPAKMRKEIIKAHRRQVVPVVRNNVWLLLGGVGVAALAATANNNSDSTLLTLDINARTPEEFANLLDSVLNQVSGLAASYGLFVPDTCPVCKQPGCDSYAYTRGSYRAVHAGCVQQDAQLKQVKQEKNMQEGNYALGILGAVLGGIVGTLPSIALLFFVNYIFAVLFALVPLCAYYGYKLFRGKMTKAVLPIVIAIALLMVPVILYGEVLAEVALYGGVFFSPADFVTVLAYMMAGDASELIFALGQMLIFMLIGIAIVNGIIRRTGKHDVLDSAFTAATLRPIAPSASIPPVYPAPAAMEAIPVMGNTNTATPAPAPETPETKS